MSSPLTCPEPLQKFVQPMLGLPSWNVKQGHGSFMTFEFGEPKLEINERHSLEKGTRRFVYVHGQWHLWIYCCNWRVLQHEAQLAWSEDADEVIGRATAILNGQKILGISAIADSGRSTFTFDLGGTLETWPYGNDPTDEQWLILSRAEAFRYRANGTYSCGSSDTPADLEQWLPLR